MRCNSSWSGPKGRRSVRRGEQHPSQSHRFAKTSCTRPVVTCSLSATICTAARAAMDESARKISSCPERSLTLSVSIGRILFATHAGAGWLDGDDGIDLLSRDRSPSHCLSWPSWGGFPKCGETLRSVAEVCGLTSSAERVGGGGALSSPPPFSKRSHFSKRPLPLPEVSRSLRAPGH